LHVSFVASACGAPAADIEPTGSGEVSGLGHIVAVIKTEMVGSRHWNHELARELHYCLIPNPLPSEEVWREQFGFVPQEVRALLVVFSEHGGGHELEF